MTEKLTRPTFPGDPFVTEEPEYQQAVYECQNEACNKTTSHSYFPDVPPGWYFLVVNDAVYLACSPDCARVIDPGADWKRRPLPGKSPLRR